MDQRGMGRGVRQHERTAWTTLLELAIVAALPWFALGCLWLIGKMGKICVNEGIVRTGAGTNYYEVGIAFYGEWYEILDVCRGNTTKDWCQINFDGTLAWISTGLLEIDGIQGGTIYGEWAP